MSQDLFKLVIKHWGFEAQRLMVIEELSELIQVVAKIGRNVNGSKMEQLVDEIVDAEIMLGQLKVMASISDESIEARKNVKLERLKKMLEAVKDDV